MTGRARSSRATNLPLRARKRKISYREPASDPEDDNESFKTRPSKHRLRSSNKCRRIADDDTVSSSGDSNLTHHPIQATASRRQNNNRKATTGPSQINHERSPGRPDISKPVCGALGAKRLERRNKKSVLKDNIKSQEPDILQLESKAPPWQTLPYEILLQIFKYAAYPLVTEYLRPSPSITSGWLLKVALLCKGFAEPALSALYYAPPLYPPSRAHKLLASLSRQRESSILNYHAKIKYLDVEADELLCHKYEGQEPIELGDFLSSCPQVRGIGIHSLSDLAANHKSTTVSTKKHGKRAPYQTSLFEAIHDNDIRLFEWTWNGHLMRRSHTPLIELSKYHKWKEFESLRNLTFFHFHRRYQVETVARSTSALHNLRSVKFNNVTIEKVEDLDPLSRSLEVLEFTNCASLESLPLAQLLASHGGELQQLVLDHNNALDLTFLQDLATNCPRLKTLKMDLRFFNTHYTYNDSEPKFEYLLEDTVVPTWPRTLQRIELFHLRKWNTAAARTFFSSIVDSAERLLDLRHIDIKASIGESNWRDRISFRNKWTSRVERVFKRDSPPPDPRLRSLAAFESCKKEFRLSGTSRGSSSKAAHDVKVRSSRFTHVEVETLCSKDTSGDSDAPLASKRRSVRLKNQPKDRMTEVFAPYLPPKRAKRRRRTSEDSSSEEDSALEDVDTADESQIPREDDDHDLYIQGMCDVVRVAIDNLRPTEEHLDESYFLDDEISGDEDWNGDDNVGGGSGYAW
ncbi:MAG: hypothetical protein Q9216_005595 [Gyalolechia sp. 2 TL-2023]